MSLIFRQFFEGESSTYTYLLADAATKDAVLIDPCEATTERDAQFVNEMALNLKYVVNTHVHADHISGTWKLKSLFPSAKSVISAASTAKADMHLQEGDSITFGDRYLATILTPGHTQGCASYLLDDGSMVFTGDALLVRGCGRTDFQGGSSEQLYHSVTTKLFTLSPSCLVYPAHDYKGRTCSSIGEEIAHNPRFTKDLAGYIDLMANLNLAKPKMIDVAVPANLQCGCHE